MKRPLVILTVSVAILYLGIFAFLRIKGTDFQVDHDAADARGFRQYVVLAENLYTKHQFTLGDYPETNRTPIYPLFIIPSLVISDSPVLVPIFQIILVLIEVWLIFRISSLFTPKWWVGVGASLIFVLDPMTLWATQIISSEILYTVLLSASIYFLFKKNYWLSGFFLGLSCLTRPMAMAFIPLFALFLICRVKPVIRGTVCLIIGAILIISPWIIRNKLVAGVYDISVNGINAFITGDWPAFMAYKNGITVAESQQETTKQLGFDFTEQLRLENSPEMKALGWELFKSQPISYLTFHLYKSAGFLGVSSFKYIQTLPSNPLVKSSWGSSHSFTEIVLKHDWRGLSRWGLNNLLYLPEYILWGGLLLFGLYGAIKTGNRKIILLLGIIFMTALLVGPISSARYRVPIVPLMAITGLIGFSVKKRDDTLSLLSQDVITSSSGITP